MTPTKETKLEWFTSTSTAPYDRHYYTVNEHRFDDYEQLRLWWFQQMITEGLTVNVHDVTECKRTSHTKGFA
jgi:hypothetical protein